jgi:hypothetical protein
MFYSQEINLTTKFLVASLSKMESKSESLFMQLSDVIKEQKKLGNAKNISLHISQSKLNAYEVHRLNPQEIHSLYLDKIIPLLAEEGMLENSYVVDDILQLDYDCFCVVPSKIDNKGKVLDFRRIELS